MRMRRYDERINHYVRAIDKLHLVIRLNEIIDADLANKIQRGETFANSVDAVRYAYDSAQHVFEVLEQQDMLCTAFWDEDTWQEWYAAIFLSRCVALRTAEKANGTPSLSPLV